MKFCACVCESLCIFVSYFQVICIKFTTDSQLYKNQNFYRMIFEFFLFFVFVANLLKTNFISSSSANLMCILIEWRFAYPDLLIAGSMSPVRWHRISSVISDNFQENPLLGCVLSSEPKEVCTINYKPVSYTHLTLPTILLV